MTTILDFLFWCHDVASTFLAKYVMAVKNALLAVAHFSLLGFLFPEFRQDFGELAATLLIGILFLSPLSRIFRMRILLQLMGLRRELGILMGYLATVHGLGFVLDPDWFQYIFTPLGPEHFWPIDPRYLFGLGAYALTLPLLLTSNAFAQRTLGGRRWKLLHRLVYGLFVFALIHRYLIKEGETTYLIQAILLLAAYLFAKLLAWNNFLPPLATGIEAVALRYRTYLAEKSISRSTDPLA